MHQPIASASASAFVLLACCCSSQHSRPGADSGLPTIDATIQDAREDASYDASAADSGDARAPLCTHVEVTASCADGMCRIPAGCFVIGAPRDEPFAAAYDDRQVQVTLSHAFEIGQTEVTHAQWTVLGLPMPEVVWPPQWSGSPDPSVPPEGYKTCPDADCPVTWLGYEDAMAYANLLSEQRGLSPCYVFDGCQGMPGRGFRCASVRVAAASVYECEGYRLPTEAEWEYAARAGTATAFYSGDISPDTDLADRCGVDPSLDAIGWYCGNAREDDGNVAPHAVGAKAANSWGLFDVSGNVWEWVNDLYMPFGYGDELLVDPVGGIIDLTNLTPDTHPHYGPYASNDGFPGWRVRRGGAYDQVSGLAKSSRRFSGDERTHGSGFRVARTLRN